VYPVKKLFVALALGLVVTASAAGSASAPPAGLTSYGHIAWNLDALVHDFYGGRRACFRRQTFTIHRCAQPSFNDGLYQATFTTARHSTYRTVRVSNPLSHVNAVGIRIGGRYIACGASHWLALTNAPAGWGESVFCVHS
jgi:hypothetical protein